MSGLREQKKLRTKETIIREAARLFIEQGYEKTTMSDVARACEVGVGTLYNYYPSKVDVLLALFATEVPQQLGELDGTTLERTLQVIHYYATPLLHMPRPLIRAVFAIMLSDDEEHVAAMRQIFATDQQFIDVLTAQLGDATVAAVIYHIMMAQLLQYVVDVSMTVEEVLGKVRELVAVVVKS